ncbi:MAG TPA: SAM-dependent methyltransferase [Trebonia sp.]|nr:SAM-dependent methyltransferase [Trebonia sp.]
MFLVRVVRFLVAEAGIGQFPGAARTGLPAANNTDQRAERMAPGRRGRISGGRP